MSAHPIPGLHAAVCDFVQEWLPAFFQENGREWCYSHEVIGFQKQYPQHKRAFTGNLKYICTTAPYDQLLLYKLEPCPKGKTPQARISIRGGLELLYERFQGLLSDPGEVCTAGKDGGFSKEACISEEVAGFYQNMTIRWDQMQPATVGSLLSKSLHSEKLKSTSKELFNLIRGDSCMAEAHMSTLDYEAQPPVGLCQLKEKASLAISTTELCIALLGYKDFDLIVKLLSLDSELDYEAELPVGLCQLKEKRSLAISTTEFCIALLGSDYFNIDIIPKLLNLDAELLVDNNSRRKQLHVVKDAQTLAPDDKVAGHYLSVSAKGELLKRGGKGESELVKVLRSMGVHQNQYRTQEELLDDPNTKDATPDVKFNSPYRILGFWCMWVEVKNCICVPGVTPYQTLRKAKDQTDKYVEKYGPGVVLWGKLGFCESIKAQMSDQIMHLCWAKGADRVRSSCVEIIAYNDKKTLRSAIPVSAPVSGLNIEQSMASMPLPMRGSGKQAGVEGGKG
ncbi:hypothetical protein B484DRAFT_482111 [Ochromonadaceae sp. CCMP2298]|nr:hypothetical protein B484DRAFT_482111 [Ochromonadaceae sp. CCMP2298]